MRMRRKPRPWLLWVLLSLSLSALVAEPSEEPADPLAERAAAFGRLFLDYEVAFIVMLAGTGVPGDWILRRQTELIAGTMGIGGEQLARFGSSSGPR